jgi:hypothetical protein
MYDELVKRLREVADEVGNDYDVDPYNAEQRCLAILQAADAIEELSKDLDSMNEANIALYGALPKWIPVTERLPDADGFTLIFTAHGYPGVCYFTSGWWGGYEKDGITHWMPFPEPPQEE